MMWLDGQNQLGFTYCLFRAKEKPSYSLRSVPRGMRRSHRTENGLRMNRRNLDGMKCTSAVLTLAQESGRFRRTEELTRGGQRMGANFFFGVQTGGPRPAAV